LRQTFLFYPSGCHRHGAEDGNRNDGYNTKKTMKNGKAKTSAKSTVEGKVAISYYDRVTNCLKNEPALKNQLGELVMVERDGATALHPKVVVELIDAVIDEGLKVRDLRVDDIVGRASRLVKDSPLPQESITQAGVRASLPIAQTKPLIKPDLQSRQERLTRHQYSTNSNQVDKAANRGKQSTPQQPPSEQRVGLPVKLEVVSSASTAAEIPVDEPIATPLTKQEREELQQHEKAIERGWSSLVEASLALRAIHDMRLYREQHKSFEEYCKKRWELARSTAYQRLELANTCDALSAVADTSKLPNERQARALAGLMPEDKLRVWKKAVQQKAKGKPTYRDLKQVRIQLGLSVKATSRTKSRPEADGTGKASRPTDTGTTVFEPKAQWKAFKKVLEREYGSWPDNYRSIFVDNLLTCVDEWREAAKHKNAKTADRGGN
jgi:hypothetical protein